MSDIKRGHLSQHTETSSERNRDEVVQLALERISPNSAALAWQNFFKRLTNGMSRSEADEHLYDEIQEFAATESPPKSTTLLPNTDTNDMLSELQRYMRGELQPTESSIVTESRIPNITQAVGLRSLPKLPEIKKANPTIKQVIGLMLERDQSKEMRVKLKELKNLYNTTMQLAVEADSISGAVDNEYQEQLQAILLETRSKLYQQQPVHVDDIYTYMYQEVRTLHTHLKSTYT